VQATTAATGCSCGIRGSGSASPGAGELAVGWDLPRESSSTPDLCAGPGCAGVFLLFVQTGLLAERSRDVARQHKHRPSAGLPGEQPALCNAEFFPSLSGKGGGSRGHGVRSPPAGHCLRWRTGEGWRTHTPGVRMPLRPDKLEARCRRAELPGGFAPLGLDGR